MARYAKDVVRVFQMTNTVLVQPKSSNSDGWAFSGFLITIIPLTIFNGWVLSVVWNWFIPTIFAGAPALTIAQALGLSLVVSTLVTIKNKDSEGKSLGKIVLSALYDSIFRGLLTLGFGLIFHFFV